MKKVLAVVVGILFVGGIVVGLSTSAAIAGPHGHHGGHWGFGPGLFAFHSLKFHRKLVVVSSCRAWGFGRRHRLRGPESEPSERNLFRRI